LRIIIVHLRGVAGLRPNDLNSKNVISKEGRHLGSVSAIEIDTSTWKVIHLVIALSDKMLQPFGLTLKLAPGLKHMEVLLPVDTVETIGDVIVLNKTVEGLKESIKKASS
jgi:sporulation protein YlmC with PRC-barrel domain